MGQLLFEEEIIVRENTWRVKIAVVTVVIALRAAAVLFSQAERHINGTAAAGQPANGSNAKSLLDPAILLRRGNVFDFTFNESLRLLQVVALIGLSCTERIVDCVVASEEPTYRADAAAALGLHGNIVARKEFQPGIENVSGINGDRRARHMQRKMANI